MERHAELNPKTGVGISPSSALRGPVSFCYRDETIFQSPLHVASFAINEISASAASWLLPGKFLTSARASNQRTPSLQRGIRTEVRCPDFTASQIGVLSTDLFLLLPEPRDGIRRRAVRAQPLQSFYSWKKAVQDGR